MIVNHDAFMLPNEHGEQVKLTYVLTEDAGGSQAVYIGVGSPEFVARNGKKQNFNEAKELFYGIEKQNYRR